MYCLYFYNVGKTESGELWKFCRPFSDFIAWNDLALTEGRPANNIKEILLKKLPEDLNWSTDPSDG
jgi:hypothetical protein